MGSRAFAILPNDGTDCTHGNRMTLVTAGLANVTTSVGVACASQVITSDLGGTVGPSGAAAYDAVHRLYLAGSGGTLQWLGVLFPANKPEVFAATARLSLMSPHPAVHDGPEVDGIALLRLSLADKVVRCMRAFVQRLGSIVALTLLACRT